MTTVEAPPLPEKGSAASTTAQGIELRSIDWVPHEERHGKVWHLGAVWFSGSAELTTAATGVVAISLGGNLLWTLIAMLLGTVFGTMFVAFHSAQGPQLGLPQMIQSRAQFGYLGVAVLVLPAAFIMYAGYNVFNGLLAAQALQNVTKVGTVPWLIVVTVVGFAFALWGYDLIHRSQRYLTGLFLVLFGIYTIGVLATIGLPAGSFSLGGFKATPFLGSFALVVSYQISWAPYVSDYSRYLPSSVGVRSTFNWTFWGLVTSGVWMFWMGAIIAAPIASHSPSTISALRSTGDALFHGWGAIVLIGCVPALVMILAMNMYGGSLVMITIIDSFKKVTPTIKLRAIGIFAVAVLGCAGAIYSNSNASFLTNYNNLLVILLYLFGPWTSINLVDYYLVRRGHYAIKEIFNPVGMYGRWGWRGLTAYVVGFVASAPCWNVGTWYEGPVAKALGNNDISFFVGIAVSALVYFMLTRSLDLVHEREVEHEDGGFTAAELDTVTPLG
ncbi:MAG TPA: cytosine permease [Solirubrobacteraceae bacterium]|jgi:purine-cytosine permease-like protein|nr:cytosine permease [Solirubrobacteraceae bacterium]